MVATLSRLFNETSEALGGARANPGKKREIEDNSRKMGALFNKLNSGDISKNAADKLGQLCQALDTGDYGRALQIQVYLKLFSFKKMKFLLSCFVLKSRMRCIHSSLLLVLGASYHKRVGRVQLLAGYAETNDQNKAEHEIELRGQHMISHFWFSFWKFFPHLIATLFLCHQSLYTHKHKNGVPWLQLCRILPQCFSSKLLSGFSIERRVSNDIAQGYNSRLFGDCSYFVA